MTVPHPAAAGSLGKEFVRFAEGRSGRDLRWWQKLVAVRLLEVDDQGRLVWETFVLTMARQLGKSWLLRELLLWRVHQGDRFGEPQDILHTGKDLAVCKEVQRPARLWAKQRKDLYKVREVNGQEEIELLADGSRWMLRAKEAVYGYGVSVGAADEAWKVRAATIEEGLAPTMVEREQPQMLLVSTAHRRATSLMLEHRKLALASLESGDGDLLVEWSAPSSAELDDTRSWRMASPYWTAKRQKLIQKRLELAQSGDADPDPEEPDPIESFRAQWLNQWPLSASPAFGEELLPPGMWDRLRDTGLAPTDAIFVAVEDYYGKGAAVATAALLPDGRIDVGGWLRDDWDTAIRGDVEWLGARFQIRELLVGASMLNSVPASTTPQPVPAGMRETRVGLALFRDLAARGTLTHDPFTTELDGAVANARVRESQTGLTLPTTLNSHLVKAAVWAVNAAHAPAPVAAVY
jgi:hypothetical protein